MYHLFIRFFIFAACCISLQAKQVDTVSVHSPSMDTHVGNVIILPADYGDEAPFPVLYLLHGYSGNAKTWIQIHPGLPDLATRYGIIIVCPDGKNSWYWDSPIEPKMRYETYITQELIPYVDSRYRTIADKAGRAVTGLSMGGHGGLWLGFRHADLFGACGSTSGGVDIRPFPENWEMSRALGAYGENRARWDSHTVINQVDKIQPGAPRIIFDCGTEDFFYEVNEALHKKLLEKHIPHDYVSRPGAHNGAYWKNAIEYQLLFFYLFFRGI
ncbi:MAG: esterase family protein [Tannerella sp.]|nr:esterase family protein [Tannerella sp.]